MRVLITQETDWVKRNPAQQHHLAEMLTLRGHQVRALDYELLWKKNGGAGLIARRHIFENVSKIHKGAGVTVVRPAFVRLPWLDYASIVFSHRKEIQRQIKEFRPDVIVGLRILNSYAAAGAAHKAGIPFIYYWIDVLHLLIPFKPFQAFARRVERAANRRADLVLTINEQLKDFVLKLGASPERTAVIRAGINVEQFNPDFDPAGIRQQYGLTSRDRVIFFMGWLYNFSGLKELALELARTRSDMKLLIVGEGDAYSELASIRDSNKLGDRLILAGKKSYSEIPAHIAAADVCVLPAYPEEPIMQDIVPIKLYEYMAMKKPVISTRLPGVRREFGEGNGLVYVDRPEDVPRKADEILRDGIAELGEKARSFARRNSWVSITDEFEKTLKEVIERKTHGRNL